MDPQTLAIARFPRQRPSQFSPLDAPSPAAAPRPPNLGDGGAAWPAALGDAVYEPGPQIVAIGGLARGGGLPDPPPRRKRAAAVTPRE